MSQSVITRYRVSVLVIGAVVVLLLGLGVAYKDATGSGLAESIYYHVLGDAIYPVFYGLLVALLYGLALMYRRSNHFMSVSGSTLTVGHRRIELASVESVEAKENVLGLKKLVFKLTGGRQFSIAAFVLTEPVENIVLMLQTVMSRRRNPAR